MAIPGSESCDDCTFVLNTDGSLMLLETADSQRIFYLALARTDGTLTQPLVQLSAFGVFLNKALSGDGRTIAYAHDCCVYAFQVGDTGPTTVDVTGTSPSLPFDGSSVSYTKARDIFLADRTGASRQNVTNIGLVDTPIVVRSENGSTVAFLSQADLDPGRNVDGSTEAFVAFLSPSLAIDGGAASCRQQTDTFQLTGFGFTHYQPVRRFLRQSDNLVVELTPLLNADGNGTISWPFPSNATTTGRYTVWALDVASGRPSNPVIEVVSASAPCRVP